MKANKVYRELVILAAGRSSRMGQPKALLRVPAGGLWIESQVQRARESRIFDRITIVASQAIHSFVTALFEKESVRILLNPDPSSAGSFDSLRLALEASPAASEIWVQPVDCPLPTPDILIFLAECADGGATTPWARIPVHQGRGGHPVVIIGHEAIAEVRESPILRLDFVLRHWSESKRPVSRICVDASEVITQFNTPQEWAAYMKASKSSSSSSQSIASPSLSSSLPIGGAP